MFYPVVVWFEHNLINEYVHVYLYVCMYFSIDYKFVFVYEASLSSREVGGGSNPLRGPSISGSRLGERGDIYSPGGQSTTSGAGS